MGKAADSSPQQKAMNTPMIAAKTSARKAPVPAVRMMNGMMMKTDEAGVTAETVIAMLPQIPSPR